MATSIARRALRPKIAVGLAALLNFVGAFLSLKVAATIAAVMLFFAAQRSNPVSAQDV